MGARSIGDSLLAEAGVLTDDAEHPEMGGGEVEAASRAANRSEVCAPSCARRKAIPEGRATELIMPDKNRFFREPFVLQKMS